MIKRTGRVSPWIAAGAAVVAVAFGIASASSGAKPVAKAAASTFKVGLVTDIGGLNDHGFNHLAYEGLLQAKSQLQVQTTVLQSQSGADYLPNLTKLAAAGNNLVIAVGFLMATPSRDGRQAVPEGAFRDHRQPRWHRSGHREEHRGDRLRRAGGRLSGRLPDRALPEGAQLHDRLVGRWPEHPAGQPLHRRLPGGRQGSGSVGQAAERLLAELHRRGGVQAARAQPDPAGLEGRLPGRRWLRARRDLGRRLRPTRR